MAGLGAFKFRKMEWSSKRGRKGKQSGRRTGRRTPRTLRPRFEAMEDRTLLATLGLPLPMVTDTNAATSSAVAALVDTGSQNLALGAPYALASKPNYSLCTDAGDATQLTDGASTTAYFWTQLGTVGWQNQSYVAVTVDLGSVQPISGVAMNMAAGTAGVVWPIAIEILVSEDGTNCRDVGDLIALNQKANGPLPQTYAIRRLATTELQTKGRFVSFVVIGKPYVFMDEVEVIRGSDAFLANPAGGRAVTDFDSLCQQVHLQRRFTADVASLRNAIQTASITSSARTSLLNKLNNVVATANPMALPADGRLVFPINDAQTRLFQLQAELWRAKKSPVLSVATSSTWDPLDPFASPRSSTATIQVDAARGEYRAAAFELYNSTNQPMQVRVSLDKLPGGRTPGYLQIHSVEWTDTAEEIPVAAALPTVKPVSGSGWDITVPSGLVRQVWMTFHPTDLAPGIYTGYVTIRYALLFTQKIPIRFQVWPVSMPAQTTLLLGGWDYTDGDIYGLTPQNRQAFLAELQSHYVNAPWATMATMMSYQFSASDPSVITLNTERFDNWIAQWPQARQYMIFLNVQPTFAGQTAGTEEFNRRVATWITAWVEHLKEKGISPDRLSLLLQDEPRESTNVAFMVAWAKAIKAAQPQVVIWSDPIYRDMTKVPADLLAVSDVLVPCREMWLQYGQSFQDFYLEQQRLGKDLELYSVLGPTKLHDPYSSYRLMAWQCWQIGATGATFWSFSDNSGASSWNEYLSKMGPYTPLFLDSTTVTSGKQMEGIREGVQDFECLVMLRDAVNRAKAAGRSDTVVTNAETLLKTAAQDVLSAPGATQLRWHNPKDRSPADAARVKILAALTQLAT